MKQLDSCKVPILPKLPEQMDFDVIVDAIFGFSFKGTSIREPYKTVIADLKASGLPVASVDVPSGWSVESGPMQ